MTSIAQISTIAEQVVRNLATVHSVGEVTTITTPILAYGHTFVSVRLVAHGNCIMVSDGGFARREVEMLGGDAYFAANAYRIAQRYGIQCDGDLFFSIEGHDAIDEITAAVAAVATAAVRTAQSLAATSAGAVAFSRTGDPSTGDFGDAEIMRSFGTVPDVDTLLAAP